MTKEEQALESERMALEDIDQIGKLKDFEPFSGYFLRKLGEKIAARERKVLDVQTPADETTIEKRIIEALRKDVLELLAQNERACLSILRK